MKKVIIALVSGIVMALAAAPSSAFYLAWIALIPLWYFLVKVPSCHAERNVSGVKHLADSSLRYRFTQNDIFKTFIGGLFYKQKIPLAIAWGFGYYGLALFWITGIHPMTWMGVPWLASLLIAIVCWLLITLWGVTLVTLWAIGMTAYQRLNIRNNVLLLPILESALRVLLGVALWCSLEWIWSQSPLWWSSLAYTQSPDNLAILQLGKISGFSTITASIVAVNGLIAEGILYFYQKPKNNVQGLVLITASLLLGLSLYTIGFFLYQIPLNDRNEQAIKIGLIQGNIPNEIKLYLEGWQKAIEGYTRGYQQLSQKNVDLIITPETALPFFWNDIVKYNSLYPAILDNNVPLILGAFGEQESSYTNSLFAVTGNGEIVSRYDKVKLVPLGEYIPFESVLGKIINRLSPLDAHLAAGNSQQIFNTSFGQVIAGICYDSAFSEHFRRQTEEGGEFIITASNNAHYSAAMPAQHHAQDVMRAIESDRWMARATNTGYSAIVNPHGKTLWISDLNTYEIHADTIYRRQTKTLYVQWGDWLTKILLAIGIIIIVFKFYR